MPTHPRNLAVLFSQEFLNGFPADMVSPLYDRWAGESEENPSGFYIRYGNPPGVDLNIFRRDRRYFEDWLKDHGWEMPEVDVSRTSSEYRILSLYGHTFETLQEVREDVAVEAVAHRLGVSWTDMTEEVIVNGVDEFLVVGQYGDFHDLTSFEATVYFRRGSTEVDFVEVEES